MFVLRRRPPRSTRPNTLFPYTTLFRSYLLGERGPVATLGHAIDYPVPESADGAGPLEGRHGASQLVGLTGTEARADHGDLHGLLLEQRYSHGLAEYLSQGFRRIGYQIGRAHV